LTYFVTLLHGATLLDFEVAPYLDEDKDFKIYCNIFDYGGGFCCSAE